MLPKPGEDSETELMRAQVIPAMADLGHDAALRAQAHDLTRRFLTDPHSVSPAAAQIAVPIAALDGDAALHDALVDCAAARRQPARALDRTLRTRQLPRSGAV